MKPQWLRKRTLGDEPERTEIRNGLGELIAVRVNPRRTYHKMPRP